MTDKAKLLEALLAKLAVELDLLTRAAHLARDEAISEESRAESKWDTRGQEAAYLAEGQARQANELREAMAMWQTVSTTPTQRVDLGSVFEIDQAQGVLRGFVGPGAGGTEFEFDGKTYITVTPASPLGRTVMGKQIGDSVDLMVRRKPVPHRINAIH